MTLGEFIDGCAHYFAWSGCLRRPALSITARRRLDPLLSRAQRGRRVPTSVAPRSPRRRRPSHGSTPRRRSRRWKPPTRPSIKRFAPRWRRNGCRRCKRFSASTRLDLPVIWDADFLYGPKNDAGDDTYVLCEVNVSAVWPFPPQATRSLAAAAAARCTHNRNLGQATCSSPAAVSVAYRSCEQTNVARASV